MAIPNSSALTAPPPAALNLQVSSIEDLQRLARLFSASGLFGRSGNAEQHMAECAIKILAGAEAGFGPFASHNGVTVINGKPAFGANLLAQAIKRHPLYDYRVLEKTDTICRIRFIANREELGVETFTIEMAKRAGLVKTSGPWVQYPEALLFARCLSSGMRTHCPDALGVPAYTPEELGDADVVPVTVSEPVPLLTTTEELTAGAERACRAQGLSDHGIRSLVVEISKGNAEALEELPHNMLARLAKSGVTPETVARCNAEPEPETTDDDPDDLPAAWSA